MVDKKTYFRNHDHKKYFAKKIIKSHVWSFKLSCSAFNSAYVTNVVISVFRSHVSTNFLFYFYVKYVTRRFIIIRSIKVFSVDSDTLVSWCIFFTKPLRPGRLFSTSPIFVLGTAVITKILTSGILLSTSPILIFKTVAVTKPLRQVIFVKTYNSVLYWFMWINIVTSGFFFSKLFIFIFSVFNYVVWTTFLSTALFNFFMSVGTVFNLPTSKSSTFVFKLFKLVGTLTNLLMSTFLTSATNQ